MFSSMSRAAVVGFMAVALAALATGCLNDDPVAPTSSNIGVTTQTAAGSPAFNQGPPAEGTVVEGVSVPGIALGFTRAQVEEAYGDDTLWCQGSGNGFCAWAVSGGGQVDVHFQGPDGGVASDSPGDVVHHHLLITGGIHVLAEEDLNVSLLSSFRDGFYRFGVLPFERNERSIGPSRFSDDAKTSDDALGVVLHRRLVTCEQRLTFGAVGDARIDFCIEFDMRWETGSTGPNNTSRLDSFPYRLSHARRNLSITPAESQAEGSNKWRPSRQDARI